jgi:MFS family permease
VGGIAVGFELLSSLALGIYALSKPTAVWPLFVIAFIFGCARAFAAPSIRSIPPMVAPDGALPRTIAMYSATWTTAAIIGPATGGFLYAVDPSLAYFVSAALIGIGVSFLLSIKFVRPQTRQALKDKAEKVSLYTALEGLRFIRRTPILLAAISLDLFAVLFGGAVALLPAIAEDQLQVGDVAYGWLRAAPGIGAAVMAVFMASRPVTRNVGRTLLIVVGLFGAATVALGLTTSYIVAFMALVLLSGSDMVSVYIRGTLVPLVTPDDKRGRVMAVENVFIGASNELGAFESGVAAQAFGTKAAVVGGGVATLGVVALFSVFFPTLRRVDRFEDLEGHGEEVTR